MDRQTDRRMDAQLVQIIATTTIHYSIIVTCKKTLLLKHLLLIHAK